MSKKVMIKIDEKALELIDKGAREEFCSRSNFLVRHAVKSAREIIGEN